MSGSVVEKEAVLAKPPYSMPVSPKLAPCLLRRKITILFSTPGISDNFSRKSRMAFPAQCTVPNPFGKSFQHASLPIFMNFLFLGDVLQVGGGFGKTAILSICNKVLSVLYLMLHTIIEKL